MANLNKTQAQWTSLMREFLQYLRQHREIREFRRRFVEGRIRTYSMYDVGGLLTSWSITGAKRGQNVSEDGRLWLTVQDDIPIVGQATVSLYMDSGKVGLVATAVAADGATAVIVENANSGLGGSVKFKNPMAGSMDIILALDIDEGLKGVRAFDTGLGGSYAARKYTDRLNANAASFSALLAAIKSDVEVNFIRSRMKEFLQSPTNTIFGVVEQKDSNGDAQILRSGLLQELADAMGDELSMAGAQAVDANTVANGSPSYDPENVGKGVLSVVALRQNVPSGRITVTCLRGAETTLEEAFTVALQASDGRTLSGALELIIKKEWESNLIGARLKLARTITDENDGGAQVSNYATTGETLTNTDEGDLYQELTAGTYPGGNRRVNWYSDSAKTLLVARGERTGDGAVTMVEQNASGLSGSCDIAYTVDDLDMIVHLNPFYKEDSIYLDVTNSRSGKIETLIADIWGIALPTAAAPAKLPDAILAEGAEHILNAS